jgi:hypothetical protein
VQTAATSCSVALREPVSSQQTLDVESYIRKLYFRGQERLVRTFRATLAFVVVAVSFTMAYDVKAASADTVIHIPTQQYNMCGHSCGDSHGYRPAQYTIVENNVYFANPRPWIITLNEVCSYDLNSLYLYLQSLGYTYDRYASLNIGGSCGYYGTAMFTLGGNPYAVSRFDLTPYNNEPRALMCREKSTYVGLVPMCVTHLITTTQNSEAYMYYRYSYSNSIRLIGGDFNSLPAGMTNWYYTGFEADTTNYPTFSTEPGVGFDKKIDYSFIYTEAIRSGHTECDTWSLSDHCYYFGDFYFTL